MEKSRIICDILGMTIRPDEQVMVYCTKEPEVETSWLIKDLINRNISVIVPIIQQKDTSLRLSYLSDPSCLSPSTFRVPEPVGYEIPADPADITTAIIPMLGYDLAGGRLGYGAGYYDRFLSMHQHIRTIGIAYACQEVSYLPTDSNDMDMTAIVTEDGIAFQKKQDNS
jgi:5-formyltetrahydrofolate cyclo-ligase